MFEWWTPPLSVAVFLLVLYVSRRMRRETRDAAAVLRSVERQRAEAAARMAELVRHRREAHRRQLALDTLLSAVPAEWAAALGEAVVRRDALPWLAFADWCEERRHDGWAADARSWAAELRGPRAPN